MRGLDELEAAELDERDVAPRQLDLQHGAVVRGAEQHRLLLEGHAGFAVLQDGGDDAADLADVVQHRDQRRRSARPPLRAQVLREPLARQADDGIGRGQDRLRRAVVLLQRDDRGRRLEVARKVQDVAHAGGAEAVDRLRVVAHHREARAIRLQPQQDRGLQRVGVLVLVDHDVVEQRAHLGRQLRDAHQLAPVEQQIVVVEHVLGLLGLDVGCEQPLQLVLPLRAPGELLAQHHIQRLGGVDGARVDGEARGLQGEALRLVGQAELVAHEVHQVARVLAVMDRERGIEADGVRIHAQQPRAHGVEGARPQDGSARAASRLAHRTGNDALDPALHLGRRPAREGEQQHAAGVGAVHDQVRDPVRQRVGLARAGPRDHQQRSGNVRTPAGHAVLDGAALLRIEAIEVERGRHRQGPGRWMGIADRT